MSRIPLGESQAVPPPPPKGYASWLDYAADHMDTRPLELESGLVCGAGGGGPTREEMRQAVKGELEELRRSARMFLTQSLSQARVEVSEDLPRAVGRDEACNEARRLIELGGSEPELHQPPRRR